LRRRKQTFACRFHGNVYVNYRLWTRRAEGTKQERGRIEPIHFSCTLFTLSEDPSRIEVCSRTCLTLPTLLEIAINEMVRRRVR
jgi:hypothetical protein